MSVVSDVAMALAVISSLGWVFSLVALAINAVRKRPKRLWAWLSVGFFALLMVSAVVGSQVDGRLQYEQAKQFLDQGSPESAIPILVGLKRFKDAPTLLDTARQGIKRRVLDELERVRSSVDSNPDSAKVAAHAAMARVDENLLGTVAYRQLQDLVREICALADTRAVANVGTRSGQEGDGGAPVPEAPGTSQDKIDPQASSPARVPTQPIRLPEAIEAGLDSVEMANPASIRPATDKLITALSSAGSSGHPALKLIEEMMRPYREAGQGIAAIEAKLKALTEPTKPEKPQYDAPVYVGAERVSGVFVGPYSGGLFGSDDGVVLKTGGRYIVVLKAEAVLPGFTVAGFASSIGKTVTLDIGRGGREATVYQLVDVESYRDDQRAYRDEVAEAKKAFTEAMRKFREESGAFSKALKEWKSGKAEMEAQRKALVTKLDDALASLPGKARTLRVDIKATFDSPK